MSDGHRYAVIEPGSEAWAELEAAIREHRQGTLAAWAPDTWDIESSHCKIKIGGGMWSPELQGNAA